MILEFVRVLGLGLVAGTVGGIVGFGSSIMLMPALVLLFGPRGAVPIMAIAALLANAGRVLAWWREIDWRAMAAYSITAMPAAALGARTLLALPVGAVEAVLGLFFLAMVPMRRWGDDAVVGVAVRFRRPITQFCAPPPTSAFPPARRSWLL